MEARTMGEKKLSRAEAEKVRRKEGRDRRAGSKREGLWPLEGGGWRGKRDGRWTMDEG